MNDHACDFCTDPKPVPIPFLEKWRRRFFKLRLWTQALSLNA